MSGTGNGTRTVFSTGDARIDGILAGRTWTDSTILYSLPASRAEYGPGYGAGEQFGHLSPPPALRDAVTRFLDITNGNAADDGFSIEGFTARNFQLTSATGAHLRINLTASDPYNYGTAWGYFPSSATTAGDVWMTNRLFDFSTPRAGQYAHITLMHEIGHALGLKHGHETDTYGALPFAFDAMEYSVMTYRSYIGAGTASYANGTNGYAQSWMMSDIAALQRMFGADFTTNSGDTVYSWTPGSGDTLVNGAVAINPASNRIFATVWDGGGNDTYDLSAYATALSIDLAPGQASRFGTLQLAELGQGNVPAGNIYNALLYSNDTRSLIENAIGGSGNDSISGNRAANRLDGGAGDDDLSGFAGDDELFGRDGRDIARGNGGDDILHGGGGRDILRGGGRHDTLNGGDDNDLLLGQNGRDLLRGGNGSDTLKGGQGVDRMYGQTGNDRLFGDAGRDELNGNDGNDRLDGGVGNDRLTGGTGNDRLTGGAGRDVFVFSAQDDSPTGTTGDTITDFLSGTDRIDLSAFDVSLSIGGTFSGQGASAITRAQGADLLVRLDLDADGAADMSIRLENVATVQIGDFIL